jgi:hypothetical protein
MNRSQAVPYTHATISRHSRDSLNRAQYSQDLARDRCKVVNGADRLPPRPPVAPGAILGLAAEHALVQGCLRGIFDLEKRLTAPRVEVSAKLAIRERRSEALEVLTLPVQCCHEAEA